MPWHAPHFEPVMPAWLSYAVWMAVAATCLLLARAVHTEIARRRAARVLARGGEWACTYAVRALDAGGLPVGDQPGEG